MSKNQDELSRYFSRCCDNLNKFPAHLKKGMQTSMTIAYKYLTNQLDDCKLTEKLLAWTDLKKYRIVRQEPYAIFLRLIFMVKKNGRSVSKEDLIRWNKVLPRIEKIINSINRDGSLFAKTIFNESIGHRYSNYFILCGQYEQEMVMSYLISSKSATEANLYKNIDSSIYWLARAYEKYGNVSEAKKYFCLVANRKGRRYGDPGQSKKIRYSKRMCRKSQNGEI